MSTRLVIDPEATLACGRCRQTTRRVILPYWRDDGHKLCPACCEAALVHYEALPEGWPADPATGRRPPKLELIASFMLAVGRFPQDDEISDDGEIIWPEPPEPEETPEW